MPAVHYTAPQRLLKLSFSYKHLLNDNKDTEKRIRKSVPVQRDTLVFKKSFKNYLQIQK
jgi:hypothetical protein